ncbi:hypothetical protein [Nocardia salmonicida]|uniref:hypothetical protein n=1 Tax=Nocardia salmonicida TaxID=53431 RepID=UPI000A478291|nr:hypothetical protein [Nocardia salmonicida]
MEFATATAEFDRTSAVPRVSNAEEKRKLIHTEFPLTGMLQQFLAGRTRLPVEAAS